jgi:hypothetical protein
MIEIPVELTFEELSQFSGGSLDDFKAAAAALAPAVAVGALAALSGGLGTQI